MVCAATRCFELWLLLQDFLSVEWEADLARMELGAPKLPPLPQAGSLSLAPLSPSAASPGEPFQQEEFDARSSPVSPAVSKADCYVQLWLPTASPSPTQTRTVTNCSDPEWNETFHYRIHGAVKVQGR